MFIGLDLGTSGVRALLIDGDGQPVHCTEVSLSVSRPKIGWNEQNPHEWIDAAKQALLALAAAAPREMTKLAGISLSGQMHGATLLDQNGDVLRPCMLWNDTRSYHQAARFDGLPGVHETTGNIVFPGFTAPKVAWVAENEPEVFSRISKVLLPKDFLSYWLTGCMVTDMSDGAGTSWMDVGARSWSNELVELMGMRPDQLPELVEGSTVIGTVRGDLANELGFPNGVQVVAGAADNAASACGVGTLSEGDGFVSLGTSGVLLAARNGFTPRAKQGVHTFCHAVPNMWYQMGVILAATDSLNWLSRIVDQDPAALTAALGPRVSGPGTIRFLPYLSGERTPHNDADVRGAFIGLDIVSEREDMTRAVLEGVCFALRDSLEALRECDADLSRVLAVGGGSQSPYWVELLATVLDLPIDLPEQGEYGAALGAARLAICGVTGEDPSQVMSKPPIARTVEPRPDLRDAFAEAYASYTATYPVLKAMP